MENVGIEQLIEDAKGMQIERKSDFISYKEFLAYFSNLDEIKEHNLIISIYFTYGLMPTIFKFKETNFEKSIEILNRAKKGGDLIEQDYLCLKSLFNNSLVGTSKILHFINPAKYPIWDSRVCRYLNKGKYNQNIIGSLDNYLIYKKLCEDLIANKKFGDFYQSVKYELEKQDLDTAINNLRAIELVMFLKGKRQSKNKQNKI